MATRSILSAPPRLPILKGAAAYTLITFPLAAVWHMILFGQLYWTFGYIEEQPSLALGFITILLQGLILSSIYPHISFQGSPLARGLKYGLAMGIFFWTSHVLAFIAKQSISQPVLFAAMESFYLFLQFGIYGIFLGYIHRQS